jgi:hypothetical protein
MPATDRQGKYFAQMLRPDMVACRYRKHEVKIQ